MPGFVCMPHSEFKINSRNRCLSITGIIHDLQPPHHKEPTHKNLKPEKRGRGRPKGSFKGAKKVKTVKKTGESIGKSRGRPKLSDDEKANRAATNKAKKLRKKQLKVQKQQKQNFQKQNSEKLETMEVVEASI